ncbi:MAG: S8 family peptidase [Elusimicrobia bacterium]|nr:S8 family peptidase [Elusimicrobiota bacterium]
MKKIIISLTALFFLSQIAAASQKIVMLKENKTISMSKDEISSLSGKIIRELPLINAVVVQFPDYIKDAEIYTLPSVDKVEEDSYRKWIEETSFAANPLPTVESVLSKIKEGEYSFDLEIPKITPEEQKEMPWGVSKVNAYGAWEYTQGEGVKVAVIDTGIDYNHPDLKPNYKGGYNAVKQNNDPLDDQGHGTHVAGTIAAVRDLNGVVGVAPKAQLYSAKVLDSNGSGQYSWIIDGIQWAVNNKMQVINMSLGGPSGSEALKAAVDAAYKAGITVVCAAGNDSGPVNYPAKYDSAIAVSASDINNKIASFSSRGAEIDFIAPGVSVYSTYKGGIYKSLSGTSMASPHMAGLAALAVSAGAKNPDEVRSMLKKAAYSLGLKPTEEGNGFIDASKLIK